MRHNKLVIAAVAACIVLSAATIDAQSWKRGLGKLKQGVEQVTRLSKPNTTRQSGDVQVPEWHEERGKRERQVCRLRSTPLSTICATAFVLTKDMRNLWASTTTCSKKRKSLRFSVS